MFDFFKSMKIKKRSNLVNAADEHCFWACDGRVMRNLEDLHKALKEMPEDVFRYHVNKEKNDFAKWIREVLKDSQLASQSRRLKTRLTFVKKTEARLKELK